MKAFNKATNCSLHLRNLQLHNSIIIKFIYSKIILYCIKKQEEIPPVNLLFIICMIKSVSQCHKTICKMYIFHYYAFVYGQVVLFFLQNFSSSTIFITVFLAIICPFFSGLLSKIPISRNPFLLKSI